MKNLGDLSFTPSNTIYRFFKNFSIGSLRKLFDFVCAPRIKLHGFNCFNMSLTVKPNRRYGSLATHATLTVAKIPKDLAL